MCKRFEGKVVVITGGAMGLGKATAVEIAREGGKLVLVDMNAEALEATKGELEAEFPGVEVLNVVANVADEAQVKGYVDAAVAKFGRIDGFYNNAGIEGRQAAMAEYDMDVFKRVIDVNLMGVYYGLRYVIPVMVAQGGGHIVNTASVGGLRGVINQAPYVASKHAVSGMTKQAAIEYATKGINVNAIAPGAIFTEMVAGAFKQIDPENPEAAAAAFASGNPTKRLGQPSEVGKVVAFLLSDDASYVNAQTLAIDGGQTSLYGFI